MSSLTKERKTNLRYDEQVDYPVKADAVIYAGSMVAVDAGYAVPASADADLVVMGRAEESRDATDLASGALRLPIRTGTFYWENLATDLVTIAQIGTVCYAVDDQTVAGTSDGGTRPMAGIIMDVDSGGVWVRSSQLALPGAVATGMLAAAAVTGPKIDEDSITSWVVSGADASSAAQDLTASGAVATLRIVSVINLTTPAVVDKSTITPGAGKFVQASGDLSSQKLLIQTLPASA
jgi:hypothetical protein